MSNKISGAQTMAPQLDNTKLYELLEIFQMQKGQGDSYRNVLSELLNGRGFLLLTSMNGNHVNEWTTTQEEIKMNLTCIHNVDGVKILAAFTDEASLLSWTKQETQYTALSSKDVLRLCEINEIDRIVINSNLPNMFVLEKK